MPVGRSKPPPVSLHSPCSVTRQPAASPAPRDRPAAAAASGRQHRRGRPRPRRRGSSASRRPDPPAPRGPAPPGMPHDGGGFTSSGTRALGSQGTRLRIQRWSPSISPWSLVNTISTSSRPTVPLQPLEHPLHLVVDVVNGGPVRGPQLQELIRRQVLPHRVPLDPPGRDVRGLRPRARGRGDEGRRVLRGQPQVAIQRRRRRRDRRVGVEEREEEEQRPHGVAAVDHVDRPVGGPHRDVVALVGVPGAARSCSPRRSRERSGGPPGPAPPGAAGSRCRLPRGSPRARRTSGTPRSRTGSGAARGAACRRAPSGSRHCGASPAASGTAAGRRGSRARRGPRANAR